MENYLKAMKQELARSRSADEDVIALLNSGFCSRKESDAWLELNTPKMILVILLMFIP